MALWLHGRTAWKEIDPGRFLRFMRSGIAVAAPDLPGHGQRFMPELQEPSNVLNVITQMLDELDAVNGAAISSLGANPMHTAIGGMSAGGMIITSRLTQPHAWRCAILESATGSWGHQRSRPMFEDSTDHLIESIDPINHLTHWRPIPVLAVHSKADEWVDWQGQHQFLDAIQRLGPPELIQKLLYERTGAVHEHVGFGRFSAEVKERERDFYLKHLVDSHSGLS
jgi:alpha-beta hydrolase superfamily lysophospholipase